MFVLSNDGYTANDALQLRDAQGDLLPMVKTLEKELSLFSSAYFNEANDVTLERFAREMTKPTSKTRNIGEATTFSKGTSAAMSITMDTEANAMKITKEEYDMQGANINKFLNAKADSHISSLKDKVEEKLIYASAKDKRSGYDGFATEMNKLAANVLSAGSATVNKTSMYIIAWGMDSVYCAYPKGSSAGLVRDGGKEFVTVMENDNDGDGGNNRYMIENFKITTGLAVVDPLAIARVCNIDTDAEFDENLIMKAMTRMPAKFKNRANIYMNQYTKTAFDIRAKDNDNVRFGVETTFGRNIDLFRGVNPLMVTEAISNAEEEVTA